MSSSNTAPLTTETTGLFNAKFFAALKPTAYFVNVARGGSVVTADLQKALEEGRIAGAGLDVVEPEPLPADHPLWKAPNLIITPHISSRADVQGEGRWLLARGEPAPVCGGREDAVGSGPEEGILRKPSIAGRLKPLSAPGGRKAGAAGAQPRGGAGAPGAQALQPRGD